MSFNIIHSIEQIVQKIGPTPSPEPVNKIEALDDVTAELSNTIQNLNNIAVVLGGAGISPTINSALAQIDLLLAGGPGALIVTGTYLPVATASANISGFPNVFDAQYFRFKSFVTVSGVVRFTTVAAAPTFSGFTLTLPFASAFLPSGGTVCAGAMTADPSLFSPQLVIGDGATPGKASFGGLAINAPGTVLASYTYSYVIV